MVVGGVAVPGAAQGVAQGAAQGVTQGGAFSAAHAANASPVAAPAAAPTVAPASPRVVDRISLSKRGVGEAVAGTLVRTGPEGVTLRVARNGVEREETVPWSDVRAVTGATGAEVDAWLPAGESLWRGRARVRRGDWALAIEPLERAAAAWRGASATPDGAAAALALTQALVQSGRLGAALPVAYEALRCLRAGVMVPPWAEGGATLVDVQRAIPAAVPPMSVSPEETAPAAAALRGFDARGDAALAESALLMAVLLDRIGAEAAPAASAPSGGAARLPERERQGVAFLEALAQAGASSPETRAAARRTLGSMRRTLPAWSEPWIRYALGESLCQERDRAAQERGVVLLLSVEVADRAIAPRLAAAAGRRAARALQILGAAAAAERVLRALQTQPETHEP